MSSRQQQRKQSTTQQKQLKQTFESIACKFILNLPPQQKSQKIRLAYHYLKAYYFYIDQVLKQLYPQQDPKKVEGKWFYDQLNLVVGQYMRKVESEDVIKIMSRQKPTCGAIILNQKQNKVLVVEWSGRLGFPKGGRNEGETDEGCAAREVKEEVGLFIHNKISNTQRVQFQDLNDMTVTFFIVRNFDQNQPIKIDKNQLDSAFWMPISEVSKQIFKFTSKCKTAWKLFEPNIKVKSKLTMEQFLNIYREKSKKKQKSNGVISQNPLLNFKFDKEKLFSVFKKIQPQSVST